MAQVVPLAEPFEQCLHRRQVVAGQGDQVVGAHEQVQLDRDEPLARPLVDRELHHQEQVVVVACRAWVAGCGRRRPRGPGGGTRTPPGATRRPRWSAAGSRSSADRRRARRPGARSAAAAAGRAHATSAGAPGAATSGRETGRSGTVGLCSSASSAVAHGPGSVGRSRPNGSRSSRLTTIPDGMARKVAGWWPSCDGDIRPGERGRP